MAVALIVSVPSGRSAGAAETASPEGDCLAGGEHPHLQVTVEDIRSTKGNVKISVYGGRPEDFLAKGRKVAKLRIPARPGTVKGCIDLPGPGVYALAAYHDEDGDRHLTRGLFGLPSEGYAFSNDPPVLLGVPSFDAVAFRASQTVTPVFLRMHYP
ncbi:DUF2141 domain-containing protein [Oleispirillum naphthae]|uniref:DUF2141 domain-containing protein n=1 Tax=Oleispirillum naphthae TaxID=2838853 RepID=UPI0030825E15